MLSIFERDGIQLDHGVEFSLPDNKCHCPGTGRQEVDMHNWGHGAWGGHNVNTARMRYQKHAGLLKTVSHDGLHKVDLVITLFTSNKRFTDA